MTSTIRQRRYSRRTNVDEYGNKAKILDRRKRALALRAQGHSYRSIAELMGVDVRVAWTDCNYSLEQLADEDSAEAVKVELLEVLRLATGALVQDIEHQREHGQVETIVNAAGDTVTKVRAWINTSSVAELQRICGRIAALLNIGQAGPDDQAAATGPQTSIVLVSPGDPAQFAQHAQQLAAAKAQEPAIDVQVAGQGQEPPSADAQPLQELEPPQAASEGPLSDPELEQVDVEAALARIAAARGQQRPRRRGPRFLPAPQRN